MNRNALRSLFGFHFPPLTPIFSERIGFGQ
jgi:hypothetical protein